MSEDILTTEERGGLTMHGENISAQIRHETDVTNVVMTKLILHILEDTGPEIVDGDLLIGERDMAKLRELLNEEARRG